MNSFCNKLPLTVYPLKIDLPKISDPHALITFQHSDVGNEMLAILKDVGITGFSVQGFFTKRNLVRTRCHIDTPIDGPPSRARLNYIVGGSSSYMSWYATNAASSSTLLTGGVPYQAFDIDKCEHLYSQHPMSGWWAVETAIAHVAQNPSIDDRWCISFIPFTDERCSMSDIVNRFRL